MATQEEYAPGWPGIDPRWTSSAKIGVGTALSARSRVWFALSHGIINEIYFPRVDQACTRDVGLIVTDGNEFFSEEKRHATFEVEYIAEGAPAYHLTNTCQDGRYRIEKRIISDPRRDVVLQQTSFVALKGDLSDYHLYVLLAPHIYNRGMGNNAWLHHYKGVPMLLAERENRALALACSAPWLKRSAGFVGVSDGWQDLKQHKQMQWEYRNAENGNTALTGEIDIASCDGEFLLAIGFGNNSVEAANRALSSINDGFDDLCDEYISDWQQWQDGLDMFDLPDEAERRRIHTSTAVMRTHEAKSFPGGTIASLSIPWGFARGDDDLGGYHLVWPRDMVEVVTGLMAAGSDDAVLRALYYLQTSQEADGHWPQNMWLDGWPYWHAIQMDEVAFPVLLVGLATREGLLDDDGVQRFWPMVRKAAGYIARNGPVTEQDRWEEDAGYSPYTLAAEISALLVAADIAEQVGRGELAPFLRETADAWNASIERWIYATDTDLADEYGVDGYYTRIAPPDTSEDMSPKDEEVEIKNRPPGDDERPAKLTVSCDALALVRFGLRPADDQKIRNTVKVIDGVLKVETPSGPAWHRYNDDGYGEHDDGSAFDGTGTGRAWPLLTCERAHYELAAGNRDEAKRLCQAVSNFSNSGGMISEQVWDSDDIPEHDLYCGEPTGSAMPLAWAHAEHVKLMRSLSDERVFDMPRQSAERYLDHPPQSPHAEWRFNQKRRSMPADRTLRIETLAPATVHWSTDGWATSTDTDTIDTGLGVHLVDLTDDRLGGAESVVFTFYWHGCDCWEGEDFEVKIDRSGDAD